MHHKNKLKKPHFNTGKHRTEEYKKWLSKKYSGKGNPMYGVHLTGKLNGFYGKHHTEESKRKNSIAHKGRFVWN